jgi:hypothetical protein
MPDVTSDITSVKIETETNKVGPVLPYIVASLSSATLEMVEAAAVEISDVFHARFLAASRFEAVKRARYVR